MTGHPVESQPPSAKLVYKILEYEGELTRAEIEDHTYLASSTVTDSLDRLDEAGLVDQHRQPTDPMRPTYAIPPEIREEAEV